MTLRSRKPRRYLAAICAAALAAAACGRFGRTLIELRPVHREIVRLAAGSNVSVRIANYKYLYISIANSPIRRLPAAEKAQRALEIARLGYAAYASRASLERVFLWFPTDRTYGLLFSTSHFEKEDSFSYRSSELVAPLSRDNHAMPPPPSGVSLYVLPIGDLPATYIDELGKYIRARFALPLTVLAPLEPDGSAYDDSRSQLVAEDLITAIQQRYSAILRQPGARLIGITPGDMYTRTENWAFTFSLRDEDDHVAVVSYARMDPALFWNARDDALIETRLLKMIAKDIGIMCYGRAVSKNPRSVLYGNIGGTDELDVMTDEFDP